MATYSDMTGANIIDVHHHILPDHYVRTIGAAAIAAQGSSGRVPLWSVANALQGMDDAGIQTAITSISSPALARLAACDATALARWCNDFAAGMVRAHPRRFGMFATVPMHDMDACLHEVAHALDTLGADGVCLLSNYQGRYLGDKGFGPLYEELNRRGAVVFVHPTAPQQMVQINQLSPSTLEFPFDTARTAAALIFDGVIRRYPAIRWILSHAGGVLPYLAGRIEMLSSNNPALHEHIPAGFAAKLARMYFDIALSVHPAMLGALASLTSTDRLLFGSDYPTGPRHQMALTARHLQSLDWPDTRKKKIQRDNAISLFPRLSCIAP